MIELIAGIGVGIVIGMYVVSQIQNHIERSTQNKDLIDNINRMDNTSNDTNISHYYTYIKKEKENVN